MKKNKKKNKKKIRKEMFIEGPSDENMETQVEKGREKKAR